MTAADAAMLVKGPKARVGGIPTNAIIAAAAGRIHNGEAASCHIVRRA
jgi:hypothetical protein